VEGVERVYHSPVFAPLPFLYLPYDGLYSGRDTPERSAWMEG